MIRYSLSRSRYITIFSVAFFLAIIFLLALLRSSSGLEFSVSILRQPDLVINNISISDLNPMPEETVTVRVEIENQGTTSTTGFMLDVYDNPAFSFPPSSGSRGDLGYIRVPSLGMGEVLIVEFKDISWPYPTDAVHDIWAQIDTDKEVGESDEGNNAFGPTGVLIDPVVVDLKVLSITPSDLNPSTGETITVDIVVKNQGLGPVGSFDVDLFDGFADVTPSIGDSGTDWTIVNGLDAGAQVTVSFQMFWDGAGARYLFAIVDTKQLVQETNESNNISGPVSFSVYEPSFTRTEQWNSGGPNTWSWDASKVVKGDFDGDGVTDIVALYGYKTERDVKTFFFKGNPDGSLSSPVVWWSAGAGNWDFEGSKLTSGDYNGDGKWDIAILYGYQTERDVRAFVFTSNGSGFNNPAVWFHAGRNNWDWNGSMLDSGDFDNDGKYDLVILYGYKVQRDVVAFVFPSTGNSFSASEIWWRAGAGNWDWAGSILSVGDFDGDGSSDVAILYGYQVERDVASFVFLSNGSNAFKGSSQWWRAGAGNWDWAGSRVTAGDFDGDGLEDIAIFYGYGGSQSAIFIFPSRGSSFSKSSLWYNSGPGNHEWSATKILSGDFDGSGADELAGFFNHGNSRSGIYVFR